MPMAPDPSDKSRKDELVRAARAVRRAILEAAHRSQCPHIGSALSVVELLVALYFRILNVRPECPRAADRDRFILSKGHSSLALYATLALRGFLRHEDLRAYAVNGGGLHQHPTRDPDRGIEVTTGSLGHGLSVGAGMALASTIDQLPYRTFVLLGDGELNEGSVWEAAMFAGHHRLDRLTAIVDANGMQALGLTADVLNVEPVADKFAAFNWSALAIDGHDLEQVVNVLTAVPFEPGKPSVVIARTTKGRGVSFMENQLLWHYRHLGDDEYRRAMDEVG